MSSFYRITPPFLPNDTIRRDDILRVSWSQTTTVVVAVVVASVDVVAVVVAVVMRNRLLYQTAPSSTLRRLVLCLREMLLPLSHATRVLCIGALPLLSVTIPLMHHHLVCPPYALLWPTYLALVFPTPTPCPAYTLLYPTLPYPTPPNPTVSYPT